MAAPVDNEAEVEELAAPDATAVPSTAAGDGPPSAVPQETPAETVFGFAQAADPRIARGVVLDTGGAPVGGAEIV